MGDCIMSCDANTQFMENAYEEALDIGYEAGYRGEELEIFAENWARKKFEYMS